MIQNGMLYLSVSSMKIIFLQDTANI